jgi:hypothetical protein
MSEDGTAKQDYPAKERELHWRNHVETWRASGLRQATPAKPKPASKGPNMVLS